MRRLETARESGASVAIIDHGPLGGLCILRGCMPTKTILRSSDVMSLMRRAKGVWHSSRRTQSRSCGDQ